jgi:hypothetical protein
VASGHADHRPSSRRAPLCNPAKGAVSIEVPVPADSRIDALSCPSASFCVVIGELHPSKQDRSFVIVGHAK